MNAFACYTFVEELFTKRNRVLSMQGSVNFKFGVLFAKQGQTTDDEILSNGKKC